MPEKSAPDTPRTIDAYLAAVDPAFRAELERIRALVHRIEPSVEETIAYRMPTLTYGGRALVHFTASKKHLSFMPSSWAIEELADRLAVYSTTEHTIRFTPEHTLPDDLVEDLVRIHVRDIDAGRRS
ncbi:iron chaperone [Brachybacterium sp. AOP25-B2-12]|uniref:iron chaperone n=1 Tax=Brachybacterium sp. AOP25-B2-12 TaxID=3457710 RepID=UPI0040346E7C